MSLSLLLATIGRSTLRRALESLVAQDWGPGDEVLVLSDGDYAAASAVIASGGFAESLPVRHLGVENGPHKDWGHTPRNVCMIMARATHLCHFDDDDVALPGMVAEMKKGADSGPGVHMFRMVDFKSKRKVFTDRRVLLRQHVSTQNIVHPNDPATWGVWGSYYGGDSQFIIETAGKCGGLVTWHDRVTCLYNPPHDMDLGTACGWYARLAAGRDAASGPRPAPGTRGRTSGGS